MGYLHLWKPPWIIPINHSWELGWFSMNPEEMLVAGLLCVYVLWLGVELQIFGAKSGYELGVLEGRTCETEGETTTKKHNINARHRGIQTWTSSDMAMEWYGSIPIDIPFLGGWTSILTQLFWCELQGYHWVLTHCHIVCLFVFFFRIDCILKSSKQFGRFYGECVRNIAGFCLRFFHGFSRHVAPHSKPCVLGFRCISCRGPHVHSNLAGEFVSFSLVGTV